MRFIIPANATVYSGVRSEIQGDNIGHSRHLTCTFEQFDLCKMPVSILSTDETQIRSACLCDSFFPTNTGSSKNSTPIYKNIIPLFSIFYLTMQSVKILSSVSMLKTELSA